MKQERKICGGIYAGMSGQPENGEYAAAGIPDTYRNALDLTSQEIFPARVKTASLPQEGRCGKYRRRMNKNDEMPLSRNIVSGVGVFPYVNMTTHDSI